MKQDCNAKVDRRDLLRALGAGAVMAPCAQVSEAQDDSENHDEKLLSDLRHATAQSGRNRLAVRWVSQYKRQLSRGAFRAKRAARLPMSALGQKRTLGRFRLMSALPPKADIAGRDRHGDPVRRKVGHTTAPGQAGSCA